LTSVAPFVYIGINKTSGGEEMREFTIFIVVVAALECTAKLAVLVRGIPFTSTPFTTALDVFFGVIIIVWGVCLLT
jgi:hypothetical protein